MLRTGFLGTLSDWVSEEYSKHPREMDTAAEEFDLMRVAERQTDTRKVVGLFSEWLVFDRRARIFGGKTGLEYFCAHNPCRVSEQDLAAYRDLLAYKVGLFAIQSVDSGRNVTLADMRGNEYVVHDITASMNLRKGAVWTRIASVSGVYQMVGSLFVPLPFVFGAGLKTAAAEWGERSMDARDVAEFLSPDRAPRNHGEEELFDSKTLTSEECARRRVAHRTKFENALRACGMRDMFTIAQYEKWLTDERGFLLGFASKAVFFLVPEYVSDKNMRQLIDASMYYANYVPRPKLKGRCPAEMPRDGAVSDPEYLIEQDILSHEPFAEPLRRAHELMASHKWREGYDAFAGVIETFLEQKIPTTSAFRIFANAAIVCFNEGEARGALGEHILLAALRLNPRYDFGLRLKKQKIDPLDDFSKMPQGMRKRDAPLIKNMRKIIQELGERQYRRTVFRKYEDFLKKCGISLSCKTESSIMPLREAPEGAKRQGRNELCSCGSGKKYKKCHGQ